MPDHWLISDMHLRHQNIYRFVDKCGNRIRPQFLDAYEGDAYMIEAWNQTVKPEDHIWNLGDFCMGSAQSWIDVGQRLQGHKRIIPGNHDKVQIDVYKKAGFQKLCGANELQIAGLRLLCTHYPVHESCLFKRDASIHGHTHQNPDNPTIIKPDGSIQCWLNVSVERISYRPIHIEDVAQKIRMKIEEARYQ